jgi:ceroid-lipofuscinosis MFS transporter 7
MFNMFKINSNNYYILQLAPNNTEAFYGILIAVYSLAQVISSPLVGWFSNCMGGRVRLILIGLEAFMMVGNCLYFLVELFPREWARILLMIARFFVGIGMANIGLLKSYVSVASTSEDRSKAIALLTSGHALGTTFGPGSDTKFKIINIIVLAQYSQYSKWPSRGLAFRDSAFLAPSI